MLHKPVTSSWGTTPGSGRSPELQFPQWLGFHGQPGAKVHGIVSNAPRLISRHRAGNCTAFNSKQQHTEHRSTSLEMQTQGECAEFATKQRHLAYSHLESLQPRTFNAFWTQFGWLPSELNKYWQEQAQVWNQPEGWFLHHLLEHHQLQGPTHLGARLTERLFHRDCKKLQRKSNMHSMLSCYVCMKKRQKDWSTSEGWRWLPYRLPPENHTQPTAMPWSFRKSGM